MNWTYVHIWKNFNNKEEKIMSLKDKVIFISGGSRGIGLAMAKKAAAEGAKMHKTVTS